MIIHTDETNFNNVLKQNDVCLVDFFATWCGPCRMLAEELKKVENEINIVKIDIDENPNLATEYSVDVVPTMYVFKNGKAVKKIEGYMQKNEILRVMNEYI